MIRLIPLGCSMLEVAAGANAFRGIFDVTETGSAFCLYGFTLILALGVHIGSVLSVKVHYRPLEISPTRAR